MQVTTFVGIGERAVLRFAKLRITKSHLLLLTFPPIRNLAHCLPVKIIR